MMGAMGSREFKPVYDEAAEDWERTYAMWCHLGPLLAGVSVILSFGGSFFLPSVVALVLWLIKRDESPYVDDHGREALNFQISLMILFVASIVGGKVITCGTLIPLFLLAWFLLALIGMIRAVRAAKEGRFYRYPACIRFLT